MTHYKIDALIRVICPSAFFVQQAFHFHGHFKVKSVVIKKRVLHNPHRIDFPVRMQGTSHSVIFRPSFQNRKVVCIFFYQFDSNNIMAQYLPQNVANVTNGQT